MARRVRMRWWMLAALTGIVVPVWSSSGAQDTGAADLPRLLMATTERWNAGDLEGFIAPYADETTFMTPAGPIGRDAMRARYQARYFSGGRPDQQLRFEQIQVSPIGSGHALMTGRFVLAGGGKPDQSGWFTLVWARTSGGWRIVHDHSS